MIYERATAREHQQLLIRHCICDHKLSLFVIQKFCSSGQSILLFFVTKSVLILDSKEKCPFLRVPFKYHSSWNKSIGQRRLAPSGSSSILHYNHSILVHILFQFYVWSVQDTSCTDTGYTSCTSQSFPHVLIKGAIPQFLPGSSP